MAVPLGFALMIWRLLQSLARDFISLRDGNPSTKATLCLIKGDADALEYCAKRSSLAGISMCPSSCLWPDRRGRARLGRDWISAILMLLMSGDLPLSLVGSGCSPALMPSP